MMNNVVLLAMLMLSIAALIGLCIVVGFLIIDPNSMLWEWIDDYREEKNKY